MAASAVKTASKKDGVNAKAEEKVNADEVTFYNARICPFGMRAWLTLAHKNIPHTFKEVDLQNKSEDFKNTYKGALACSVTSDGLVPLIIHKGKAITESMVVVRYLDHVFSDKQKHGAPLIPEDGFERAAVEHMVAWFAEVGWIKSHYGFLFDKQKKDKSDDEKQVFDDDVAKWRKTWEVLETKLSLLSKEGLFLTGNRLSLFEVTAFGLMGRLVTIEKWVKIPVVTQWLNKDFPRMKSWYNAMLKNEAVAKCRQTDESKVKVYGLVRAKMLARKYDGFVEKN